MLPSAKDIIGDGIEIVRRVLVTIIVVVTAGEARQQIGGSGSPRSRKDQDYQRASQYQLQIQTTNGNQPRISRLTHKAPHTILVSKLVQIVHHLIVIISIILGIILAVPKTRSKCPCYIANKSYLASLEGTCLGTDLALSRKGVAAEEEEGRQGGTEEALEYRAKQIHYYFLFQIKLLRNASLLLFQVQPLHMLDVP